MSSRGSAFDSLLHRVSYLSEALRRRTRVFGWRTGCRLWIVERRRRVVVRSVTMPGGPAMLARLGRNQTDVDTLLHVWADDGYDFGGTLVDQPSWIIDAGANAGYATRWFAARHPGARIIAIEPDPRNVELLRSNVGGLDNVTIVVAALGAVSGKVDLYGSDQPDATRVGAAGGGAAPPSSVVECVTVDQLVSTYGIERIGVLKLDIEGSEREVLSGSESWIGAVDAIVAELHDRFLPGCMRAFVHATEPFAVEFVRGENSFAVRRRGDDK